MALDIGSIDVSGKIIGRYCSVSLSWEFLRIKFFFYNILTINFSYEFHISIFKLQYITFAHNSLKNVSNNVKDLPYKHIIICLNFQTFV